MATLSTQKKIPGFAKFKNKKPSKVKVDSSDLVDMKPFFPDHELPLVVTPKGESLHLVGWLEENRQLIEEKLMIHGGVLFRGFDIHRDQDLANFIEHQPYELMSYFEGSTPRKQLGKKIYTSTLFPQNETIALHNEYSSSMRFPLKVWFSCLVPPEKDTGQTPICSARKMVQRINPDVMDEFRAKGWSLMRNFRYNLGLTWQRAYAIDDKAELERYLKENLIDHEWIDEDHLRTFQVRSAIITHPVTQDECWFNHMAFWHAANIRDGVREELISQLGREGLPYHTFFGDGTPIPDDVARHIADCYLQEKLLFNWQQGDILLADNVLISHGRQPFSSERKILVAMGQPYYRPIFQPLATAAN